MPVSAEGPLQTIFSEPFRTYFIHTYPENDHPLFLPRSRLCTHLSADARKTTYQSSLATWCCPWPMAPLPTLYPSAVLCCQCNEHMAHFMCPENHTYCRFCLVTHFNTSLSSSGQFPLRCPDANCRFVFSAEEAERQIYLYAHQCYNDAIFMEDLANAGGGRHAAVVKPPPKKGRPRKNPLPTDRQHAHQSEKVKEIESWYAHMLLLLASCLEQFATSTMGAWHSPWHFPVDLCCPEDITSSSYLRIQLQDTDKLLPQIVHVAHDRKMEASHMQLQCEHDVCTGCLSIAPAHPGPWKMEHRQQCISILHQYDVWFLRVLILPWWRYRQRRQITHSCVPAPWQRLWPLLFVTADTAPTRDQHLLFRDLLYTSLQFYRGYRTTPCPQCCISHATTNDFFHRLLSCHTNASPTWVTEVEQNEPPAFASLCERCHVYSCRLCEQSFTEPPPNPMATTATDDLDWFLITLLNSRPPSLSAERHTCPTNALQFAQWLQPLLLKKRIHLQPTNVLSFFQLLRLCYGVAEMCFGVVDLSSYLGELLQQQGEPHPRWKLDIVERTVLQTTLSSITFSTLRDDQLGLRDLLSCALAVAESTVEELFQQDVDLLNSTHVVRCCTG
jgi:hypothetical protein